MAVKYGGFVKQNKLKGRICCFVNNYLELKLQHRMILFMASLEELIIIHEDYILSLNTGLKYSKLVTGKIQKSC